MKWEKAKKELLKDPKLKKAYESDLTNNSKRYTLLNVLRYIQKQLKNIKGFIMNHTQKQNTKKTKSNFKVTVAWLGMLVVVTSIAFSTYVVFFGTTDIVAKLMIMPQVLFAIGVLIYKFTK